MTNSIEINTGKPDKAGMCVCYIESEVGGYPDKKLLMWFDGWWYPSSDQKFRGVVFGFIGPIPAPTIVELENMNKQWFIGTSLEAETDSFKRGSFQSIDDAMNQTAKDGYFIWEKSCNGAMKKVSKWSGEKGKWLTRNKKAQ